MMLDTTRTVETPEGIHLDLQVAGPVPRALAWIVDILIRTVIYVALGITFTNFGPTQVFGTRTRWQH